jgi:hypothetical protein
MSPSIIFRLEILHTAVSDRIRTGFVLNNFFSENNALYGIMWQNTVELDRPHMTIQYNTIQYNTIQYNTIQYNTI